jgi:hypothetical protein
MLVAVELSLAIVLPTGAGLMLKSFARMNERPPGFVPESVVVMKVGSPASTTEAGAASVHARSGAADRRCARRAIRGSIDLDTLRPCARISCRHHAGPTHAIRINAASPGYLKALGAAAEGALVEGQRSRQRHPERGMARQAFGTIDRSGGSFRFRGR